MKQLSAAAVERAMKLQDVMLRAMAKRITWYQAAEILGISCRQMQRWKTRFEHEGYEGLFDRRRGIPSPKRVPLETVETVLRLYQEQYFDFNVRHFHEKLRGEHQINLSYTWVKAALQGAGLVKTRRKRGKHRKRRPRRPLPGMLLHIDGSKHRWFCDERWYDLLVIMDDATSEIYYAQLVEEESTVTVMAGLRDLRLHGDAVRVDAVYHPGIFFHAVEALVDLVHAGLGDRLQPDEQLLAAALRRRFLRLGLRGRLGVSFLRGEDVRQVVLERFWPTLKLALVAMLIAVGIGVPLGFISALRHGSWLDACSMIGAVSGVSLPQFWLGLLLQIFSETLLGPVFFEFIQRKADEGFGEGNFKALFESLERDQIRRGVLTADA